MKTEMTRRGALAVVGGGILAAAAIGHAPAAFADADAVQAELSRLFGDRAITDTAVSIDMAEIAENGNMVPFQVSVDSPMTADNYVKSIHIFADGNPNPKVASFTLSPAGGSATIKARTRLAKTQNLIAVAEMSDGSLVRGVREVKVTIGGCGG